MPPRSVTVEKETVTTDIPMPEKAERMRREMQEKKMDRDTNKGHENFMKDLRLKKRGGMCWGGKAK
jgi:hypothetical protein